MDISPDIVSILFVVNIFLAIIVIFIERRDPTETWAWLMVLMFIPVVGFLMYLFLGQNLSRRKIFEKKFINDTMIHKSLVKQISYLENNKLQFNDKSIESYKSIIHMNLINSNSIFTQDNDVEIYTNGKSKFNSLIKHIKQAKSHIHLLYYIIRNDCLGKKLIKILTQKVKEGVEVRILYDALGCRFLPKRFFKKYIAAGGKVAVFFPSKLSFINLRINYRNHRKIAIIDGKYGFIGGLNIGKEYLGMSKKFGYWRDTHLKIFGSAVYMIQSRFILDWNHASNEKILYNLKYFPEINCNGKTGIQIISSGPDSEHQQIKNGYIKMINSAKKFIYIQTPYFIPDESFLDAMKIAALSGVNVKLMIPNRPDHMFVYWASISYIGELLKTGIHIYVYNPGFIHSKTVTVDGKIASVGTANIDMRSFKLNFEINAFIYDTLVATNLKNIFEDDMKNCTEITKQIYKERPLIVKFKEAISRLISPIL